MICPEGAVEVDYESRVAVSHAYFDKFVEALARAEREGSFRRLVPPDKVDWNNPYYKVYSKHPRYVIPEGETL
jgi:hypothetical protein